LSLEASDDPERPASEKGDASDDDDRPASEKRDASVDDEKPAIEPKRIRLKSNRQKSLNTSDGRVTRKGA